MSSEAEDLTQTAADLHGSLTKALFHKKKLALQCKVGYLQRDKENAFHRYKYVSAEAVLKAVNPAMLDVGLTSTPMFRLVSEKWLDRSDRAPEHIVLMECTLLLTDQETGYAEIGAVAYGGGQDVGDKATMKAETAALKYAWTSALNVPTGDDPEADTATDERAGYTPPGIALAAEHEPVVPVPTKTYTPTRPAASPASLPAGSPPPATVATPPATSEPPVLKKSTGKIADFKIATGTYKDPKRAGQKWERYDVKLEDGSRYSTFDKPIGDKASMLAAGDGSVLIYWSADPTGKYRNLEAIDVP